MNRESVVSLVDRSEEAPPFKHHLPFGRRRVALAFSRKSIFLSDSDTSITSTYFSDNLILLLSSLRSSPFSGTFVDFFMTFRLLFLFRVAPPSAFCLPAWLWNPPSPPFVVVETPQGALDSHVEFLKGVVRGKSGWADSEGPSRWC